MMTQKISLPTHLKALGRVAKRSLLRQVGGRHGFPRHADQTTEVIYKGQTVECAPGLFEPDQIDRVTACGFGKTMAQQMTLVSAHEMVEGDTHAHQIRDAFMIGGFVFGSKDWRFVASDQPHKAIFDRIDDLDRVTLPNSRVGTRYFGHWLRDDCATMLMAKERDPMRLARLPSWPDITSYSRLFGQDWTPQGSFYAKTLEFYSDLPINRFKAKRIQKLRAALHNRLEQSEGTVQDPAEIVFVKRGPSSEPRELKNQDEIVEALTGKGVTVLTPEGNAEAFLKAALGARLIISVEGSQLTHAIYTLRKGGGILVLQPPDRFYNAHLRWARQMEMAYGTVVGLPAEGGFTVPVDEITAMVDRLLAHVR